MTNDDRQEKCQQVYENHRAMLELVRQLAELNVQEPQAQELNERIRGHLRTAQEYKGQGLYLIPHWMPGGFAARDDERTTAYHEAGHGVAAVCCGYDAPDVVLRDRVDGASAGGYATDISRPRGMTPETHARRKALICYAGYHAALRVYPKLPPMGCEPDFVRAFDALSEVFTNPNEEARRINLATWHLIDSAWPAVTKVAEFLLKHRHVAMVHWLTKESLPEGVVLPDFLQ